jgi:hypothetical protein
MGNEQQQQRPRTERATVARGRTVMAPTSEKRLATYTPEGKPVHVAVLKEFGPGHEVELPVDEIVRLRAAGFLFDPSAIIPAPSQGAHVMEQA